MTDRILGVRVDPTSYQDAVSRIITWARSLEPHYVCIANVHMVMEAHDVPQFQEIVDRADLVTPDGMPLVWMLRWLGERAQQRVYGPQLTLDLLQAAQDANLPVGFLGGTPDTLRQLSEHLHAQFPRLAFPYMFSPPFRSATQTEESRLVSEIGASGIRILFVGLGCPKQERWMAAHRRELPIVMLGVGAAFDFLAGTKRQAPLWMQRIGLEWLYRLLHEPRRLWRRYLYHNPRFMILACLQLMGLYGPS